MIQTKINLVKMIYADYNFKSKTVKKCIHKVMCYPEIVFIDMIRTELNFHIEPIRKNTYIIN